MKERFNDLKKYVVTHQRLFFWMRVIVTIVLFGFILHLLNLQSLVSIFETAHPATILIALLLIALHVFIKSYKWFLLVRTVNKENTFSEALFSYLHGTGLAIITPARVGELARVFYVKGDKIQLTSLTVVDKLFELFAVVALVLAGSLEFIKNSFLIGGIAIMLLLFIGIVLNLKRFSTFLGKYMHSPSLKRALDSLKQLSPRTIANISILSVMVMLIYLLQVFLIMRGFISVQPSVIFAVFPLVLLTNLVPFTTASIGVRESAAIVLLAHFKISSEVAVSTTTLILIFDTVIPGLLGSFGAGNVSIKQQEERQED